MIGSAGTGLGSVKTAGESDAGGNEDLDTLAELYARGLANDPAVDNTLAGAYYDLYFNEDGEIWMTQATPSNGVDFDQHQAIRLMREFSIPFAVAGTFRRTTMKYAQVAQRGEIELDRCYLRNNADAEFCISTDTRYSIEDGNAAHYTPNIASGGRQTQWRSNTADVRGGGSMSPFYRHSDGSIWQQCLMPSAAPHLLRALCMSMSSREGGFSEAAVGSSIWWGITQPSNDFAGGTEMVSLRGVLDAKNFGSAQIEGHWELYASTLAGGPVLSASVYNDRVEVEGTVSQVGGLIVPVVLRTALNDDLLVTGVRSFVGSQVAPAGKKFYSLGRWGFEIATKTGVAAGSLIADVEVNGVDQGPAGVTFTAASINALPSATSTYFNNGVGMPGGAGIDLTSFPLDINVTATFTGLTALTGNFVMYGYFA